GGAMCAIAAPEAEVTEVIGAAGGVVAVAAVNGPAAVVVSGDQDAVGQVEAVFAGRGVRTRPLRVSHGFHSPLMDPMLAAFTAECAAVGCAEPGLVLVSALTGRPETAAVTEAEFWARHVREPVRFADAVAGMRAAGVSTFIEIGPDPVLSAAGPATAPDGAGEAWIPVLRRAQPEAVTMVQAAAAVWARGGAVDWAAVLGGGRLVDLPTYAFQHQNYWLRPGGVGRAEDLGL